MANVHVFRTVRILAEKNLSGAGFPNVTWAFDRLVELGLDPVATTASDWAMQNRQMGQLEQMKRSYNRMKRSGDNRGCNRLIRMLFDVIRDGNRLNMKWAK